ncbi:ABC transporter substrate-binding protein [Cohnella phaseoli]|uniref:ABC-type glycerol-3-phosphate transport system substrate-binding protein n=1 Tax=Cohnella phaseoli TaxID=456490 RepID=A0A3D9KJ40_9BACL|nr:extracellular solute-binding protein [Cohnella phaseoli]RED85553.1 ABC-type glycerol-3-phosphate transport system substrate-binding protein [Cohnella phaseoli]
MNFSKRKGWQSVFILLCVFALVAAGCSKGDNGGKGSVSGSPSASASSTPAASGSSSPEETDKPVTIKISNWPKPNEEAQVKIYDEYVSQMQQKYPYITLEKDEWGYEVSSFLPKAASGELPNVYETFFTEADKIIKANYSADITELLNKHEWASSLNPELLKLVQKDGKYYGIPKDGYVVGLLYNVNLFKEAGLVDANGVPIFPKTYEELAQTAKTIKDKTGKAGFFFPTKNNQGGWMFMNVAWAYGAEFEKQVDGKWQAVFNSPEAVAALQYVKDLKWKYDVLPANNLVDIGTDMFQMFGTDQVGMSFGVPDWGNAIIQGFKMSKDNLAMSALPAGPQGNVTLLGGGLYMFAPQSTPEQLEATFKWLQVKGFSPQATPESLAGLETQSKTANEQGMIVGPHGLRVWINEDRINAEQEIIKKYTNVNMAMFEDYMTNGGNGLRPEEPVNAQELYKTLDVVIQSVLTNKNADPKALLDKAVAEFQKDYLDKAQ